MEPIHLLFFVGFLLFILPAAELAVRALFWLTSLRTRR